MIINKQYDFSGSPVYFVPPSVATGDNCVACSPAGLWPGSGWKSDVYDLGPAPRPATYRWRAEAHLNQPPSGESPTVDLFWSSFDVPAELSSGSGLLFPPDGGVGSGDSATDPGAYSNLKVVGQLVVDFSVGNGSGLSAVSQPFGLLVSLTTVGPVSEYRDRPLSGGGMVELHGRYGCLCIKNNSRRRLSVRPEDFGFVLEPLAPTLVLSPGHG